MHTNACIEGLGTVLEQERGDRKLDPVAYASRSLRKVKWNHEMKHYAKVV